jgi:hypothetical protein
MRYGCDELGIYTIILSLEKAEKICMGPWVRSILPLDTMPTPALPGDLGAAGGWIAIYRYCRAKG